MLSWSLLDFGVSYFNARQNADRIIVASERRRRTMHVLVQDIQAAYLRAAAAQKLKKQIENTIAEATLALKNSVQVERDGLRPPLDALKYQKALLDNVKILETIDLELGTAKVELNLLINLPAKESLRLEDPDDLTVPNDYSHEDTEEFEVRAILANAELNESIYNARIAVEDTRKSLLRLFPGLTFNVGPQRSDNEYYVNKSWVEGSANISFNLWNLLSAPETIKLADQNSELAAQKRMTVQMAVISQVHLSKIQLNNSSHIYKRSAEIDAVNTRISRITSAKYTEGAASRAEKVAADAAAIVSKLQKYQALSQLFAASGKMQASTGMEPYFESLDEIPLFDMTNKVASSFREWNSGLMPAMPESVPTELPVLTTLIMPEDPSIEMPVVRAKKSNSDSQNQQPNSKKSSNKDAPLLGNILKPWAATSTAKNGNTNKGQAPNQKSPKPISPFQGWGTPPSGGAKRTSTVSDSGSGAAVNTVANNK
jgi:outer membrane protein TolC